MQPERPSTGYIRSKLSYKDLVELKTISNIDDEYWTILLYYANVPEVGMELMNTKSERLKKTSYLAFSAFIKQAKTYYDSARLLHHRAASLNYYYCFMNLAKAAVIKNQPSKNKSTFVHGLSASSSAEPNLFDRKSSVYIGKK